MNRPALLVLLCLTVIAAGCDGQKQAEPAKPAAPPTSNAPDLVKSQRDVMEKAKDVGQVLQEGDDARRKAEEK